MNTAQWILFLLLAAGGFWQVVRFLQNRLKEQGALNRMPIAVGVSAVVWLSLTGVILLVPSERGSGFPLLAILFLLMVLSLGLAGAGLWHHWGEVRRTYFLGTVLFTAFLLLITLVFRTEQADSSILMEPFHSIVYAVEHHRSVSVIHMAENAALFVPFGFLAAGILPGMTDRLPGAVPYGVMLSMAIETLQLVFRRGQCDIDDIIANAIGTLLGVILYSTVRINEGKRIHS